LRAPTPAAEGVWRTPVARSAAERVLVPRSQGRILAPQPLRARTPPAESAWREPVARSAAERVLVPRSQVRILASRRVRLPSGLIGFPPATRGRQIPPASAASGLALPTANSNSTTGRRTA